MELCGRLPPPSGSLKPPLAAAANAALVLTEPRTNMTSLALFLGVFSHLGPAVVRLGRHSSEAGACVQGRRLGPRFIPALLPCSEGSGRRRQCFGLRIPSLCLNRTAARLDLFTGAFWGERSVPPTPPFNMTDCLNTAPVGRLGNTNEPPVSRVALL